MSNIVTVDLRHTETIREFVAYASFDTNPYSNKRAIAINDDELHQELDSLFLTHKYERPYLPDYYNPLEELLGELWTPASTAMAFNAVTSKIDKYIPRIRITNDTNFEYSNYKVSMELRFTYKNDFSRDIYSYERQFDTVT